MSDARFHIAQMRRANSRGLSTLSATAEFLVTYLICCERIQNKKEKKMKNKRNETNLINRVKTVIMAMNLTVLL